MVLLGGCRFADSIGTKYVSLGNDNIYVLINQFIFYWASGVFAVVYDQQLVLPWTEDGGRRLQHFWALFSPEFLSALTVNCGFVRSSVIWIRKLCPWKRVGRGSIVFLRLYLLKLAAYSRGRERYTGACPSFYINLFCFDKLTFLSSIAVLYMHFLCLS